MANYRNKLYVAFDGDEDMRSYRLLQAWRDNQNIDFNFGDAHDLNIARDSSLTESIKVQLRERMHNSKAMLLLVGERTKYIRGYIPWEVGFARYLDLPIIVANLNGTRSYDSIRCPAALGNGKGAVHVSFQMAIIRHALAHWPPFYQANKAKALLEDWYYDFSVYRELGL